MLNNKTVHRLCTYSGFQWVSKVFCVCFGFALLCSVIGQQNLCYFFNQWETKPTPIATCMHTFSRVLCWLHGITSYFDWFIALFASVVIGQSNRPFAVYYHMMQITPCWRANCTLGHPKQNNFQLNFLFFWMAHWAICSPARCYLYHVILNCKEPIALVDECSSQHGRIWTVE